MSHVTVRTLPHCSRGKTGPTIDEVQADALEQIDTAIKALQDMRRRVLEVEPGVPGVAWQAHKSGQIAVGCASQAVDDAHKLAHLTRPLDD